MRFLIHVSSFDNWKWDVIALKAMSLGYNVSVVIWEYKESKKGELSRFSRYLNEKNISTIIVTDINRNEVFETVAISLVFNIHPISKVPMKLGYFARHFLILGIYSFRSDHLVNKYYYSDWHKRANMILAESEWHKEIINKKIRSTQHVELFDFPRHCQKNQNDNQFLMWAPHWTINKHEGLNRGSFLFYADFFIELIERDDFRFLFRPHPLLEKEIYKSGNSVLIESFEKLRMYIITGPISEHLYTNMLIVHDSVSFTFELLCIDRPIIFLNPKEDNFNEVGLKLLEAHYRCFSPESLKVLIQQLFSGLDFLLDVRKTVILDLNNENDFFTKIPKS